MIRLSSAIIQRDFFRFSQGEGGSIAFFVCERESPELMAFNKIILLNDGV